MLKNERGVAMYIHIEAFSYRYGNRIPKKYTCDGEQISPGMSWNDVPEGTKTFAIMLEDLDAPVRRGSLVLWLVYDIPADVRGIETGEIPQNARVGTNDLGKTRYDGPCPVPGSNHQRYSVLLFALDTFIGEDDVDKKEFLKRIKGHILARAEAIGTYERHAT